MLRLIWVHLLFVSLLAFKELVKLLGVNELPNLAPENLFLDKKNNNMQTDEQLSIGIQRILLNNTNGITAKLGHSPWLTNSVCQKIFGQIMVSLC